MKIEPRLHHCCQNIVKGHLNDVVELYKLLNFGIVYNPGKNAGWIMVGQKQLDFAIQIAEVSDTPILNINIKKQTHIAFISNNPKDLIKKVQLWAENKGFKFRHGGWSEIELFFDLPDIFINSVIEVMDTSILNS